MLVFWLCVSVFLSILCLGAGIIYRGRTSIFKEMLFGKTSRSNNKSNFWDNVWRLEEYSHNREEVQKVAILSAAVGIVLGFAINGYLSIVFGILGVITVPRLFIQFKNEQTKKAFEKQLPRVTTTLAVCTRTGTLYDGFKHIANEFPAPAGTVFQYIVDGVDHGFTAHQAIEKAIAEFNLPDLKELAQTVRVISELGGGENTGEILESAAEHVRFRERYMMQVKANVSEIKYTALLAHIFPLGLFLLLLMDRQGVHWQTLHENPTIYLVGTVIVVICWSITQYMIKQARNL